MGKPIGLLIFSPEGRPSGNVCGRLFWETEWEGSGLFLGRLIVYWIGWASFEIRVRRLIG